MLDFNIFFIENITSFEVECTCFNSFYAVFVSKGSKDSKVFKLLAELIISKSFCYASFSLIVDSCKELKLS